uniref:Ig-like domain-containing protein n=1 Tax=Myripristis murdjan TaxID=586833 RepID=A0A668AT32_9TELE
MTKIKNTSPTVPLLFLTVSPQILPSSGCIRAAAQINCSCEMEGNPSPAVEWQMDGRPVNDSDVFTIRHEPLNATGLVRSFITINSQGKDLSTLVCHSTNSVGSARLQFYVPSLETSVENQGLSFTQLMAVLLILMNTLTYVLAL